MPQEKPMPEKLNTDILLEWTTVMRVATGGGNPGC